MAWVAAMTTCAILAVLFSPLGPRVISPGPLSRSHGFLDADCEACHNSGKSPATAGVATRGSATPWIVAALHHSNEDEWAESRRCLSCHDLGPHPFEPHNLMLAQDGKGGSSRHGAQGGLASIASAGWTPAGTSPKACARCHREHVRGASVSLSVPSNQLCHACHRLNFSSFHRDHPGFSLTTSHAALRFDHRAHMNRHFLQPGIQAQAPGECDDCHTFAAPSGTMTVRPFDISCGACHQPDVFADLRMGRKGIPVLALPGLDGWTMEDAGLAIGQWPQFADAGLESWLELLLRTDPMQEEVVETIQSLDLMDLSTATSQQLEAVQKFAWAVKTTLADLREQGPEMLIDRLESHTGTSLSKPLRAQLMAGFPPDLARSAISTWFPNLTSEIAAFQRQEPPATEMTLPDPTEFRASPGREEQVPGNRILGDDDDILGDGDNILAADKEILDGSDDILSDDDILGDPVPGAAPAPASPVAMPSTEPVTAEQWVRLGGWYTTEYAIRYRPQGHEDPFFRSWMELARQSDDFQFIIRAQGSGLCVKCHFATSTSSHGAAVTWARDPGISRAHSIRFHHGPHLMTGSGDACQACHQLSDNTDPTLDTPAQVFSDFNPLGKRLCQECHSPSRAGGDCLLCHAYHKRDVDRLSSASRSRKTFSQPSP